MVWEGVGKASGGFLENMNTIARDWLLACFLSKIVIDLSIFSASPLFMGWHGFLLNQGDLGKNGLCAWHFSKIM